MKLRDPSEDWEGTSKPTRGLETLDAEEVAKGMKQPPGVRSKARLSASQA